MKNRNAKDVFVVITSLAVSAFALYYFWILHSSKDMKEKKAPVAVVNINNGSCFVNADSGKWTKVKNGYGLNYGEKLKLDPMTVAEISFADGHKLKLLENSFIEISFEKSEIVIDVKGNCEGLELKTETSSIVIKTDNDSIVRFENDTHASLSVKEKTLNASVAEGKITVVNSEGVEKTALQGSGFVMDYEGVTLRKPLVVLSPMCFETISSSNGTGDVLFQWNKNNTNIQVVKIEIFADKNMKIPAAEKIAEADSYSASVNLASGLYFWRISAIGSDGTVVETPEKFQSGKFLIK